MTAEVPRWKGLETCWRGRLSPCVIGDMTAPGPGGKADIPTTVLLPGPFRYQGEHAGDCPNSLYVTQLLCDLNVFVMVGTRLFNLITNDFCSVILQNAWRRVSHFEKCRHFVKCLGILQNDGFLKLPATCIDLNVLFRYRQEKRPPALICCKMRFPDTLKNCIGI